MAPANKQARTSAARDAAAMAAAQEIITKVTREAIGLHGSAPAPGASIDGCQTVGIPSGIGQTVIGALRERPNWYAMTRRQIDGVARLIVERNWFGRTVHGMRCLTYASGFGFADPEATSWAASGTYNFRQYVKDMVDEWNVSHGLTVWWRKGSAAGTLPVLNVPNNCDVEYEVVGGIPQVSITLRRDAKIPDDREAVLGKRMFEGIKKGKKLVIVENDPEFDFRVLKSGKSGAPFQVSPWVTIFDDLDFVEAIRVGDWNGAKARWEIIRHTKKGYAVTSGGNAGNVRNHARKQDLTAIVNAMKKIFGKMDMATNFDQEIAYLIFPKEHFHAELLAEVKQRLLQFGGGFALMLLKTDSQIAGLSEFMMHLIRTEIFAFREEFDIMLNGIFASESFRAGIPNAPELKVFWAVNHLYSAKALNELISNRATYGINAPQTLRRMLGVDNEEEGKLMLEAHDTPMAYTPPFEPRQGIASFFTAPDATGGNQTQQTMPGDPGRPSDQ